ncbi:MAG: hypothetical protein HZA22_08745 [Nitrospirae bacterium]|nr:hypothetical protein [Nitrospirota bacterium]
MADEQFYVHSLKHIENATEEHLFASMLSIETEFDILKSRLSATNEPFTIDIIAQLDIRISLLRKTLEDGKSKGPDKKSVFFRESAHRIDEDFILLRNREELITVALTILDNLHFTDLPIEIVNVWDKKVTDVVEILENIPSRCANDANSLAEPRINLKAALNVVNRSLDGNYNELYMVKYCRVFQGAVVLFILSSLAALRSIDSAVDKTLLSYVYYCALGALGGSLSSLLSNAQGLSKGNFFNNIFLNVFSRPIIGAASALVMVLVAKSRLLFGIGLDKPGIENPLLILPVANVEAAYRVLSIASGFGGERWLKSTMDQLISKLTVYASRNTAPTNTPAPPAQDTSQTNT